MKPQVGVIILHPPGVAPAQFNHNFEQTQACIESLQEFEKDLRIVVVDNGSNDSRLQDINAVELVSSPQNLGFAAGVNIGLRRLGEHECDYFLLLNNDTLITAPFLQKIITFEENNGPALLAPLILDQKNPDHVGSAGGDYHWVIARPQQRNNWPEKPVPYRVAYLSGCALLISRFVVNQLGLLDEDFFFGMEDVDYGLRAAAAGIPSIVIPEVTILHQSGGATGGNESPFALYHFLRGNFLLVKKHYIWRHRLIPYLYLVLLSLKMSLNCCLAEPGLRLERLNSILKAWREVFHGLPRRD